MFEKIRDLVAEGLGVEAKDITLSSKFKEDLDADSLDLFDLVTTLEDEFGVEIPSDELENITTVGDIVTYVENNK